MIDFSKPVRFRGIHAAYAQFLTTERGTKRIGGVNIFSRIMDAYLISILVGLKFSRVEKVDETEVLSTDIFGDYEEYKGKTIKSSDIPAETIHASQSVLYYIYRIVMLNENERNLSDEEKIANAFKSDSNQEKIDQNIELMNAYARGGLEILYERFRSCSNDIDILAEQYLLLKDMNSLIEYNENDESYEDY